MCNCANISIVCICNLGFAYSRLDRGSLGLALIAAIIHLAAAAALPSTHPQHPYYIPHESRMLFLK